MLKSMRATLSEEGLDGEKSSARDTYTSLADVEVTRSLVRHDTMGLTAFLERALSRAPSGMALKEMLGPTDVKI
jgi:Rod binding domain-containing protein